MFSNSCIQKTAVSNIFGFEYSKFVSIQSHSNNRKQNWEHNCSTHYNFTRSPQVMRYRTEVLWGARTPFVLPFLFHWLWSRTHRSFWNGISLGEGEDFAFRDWVRRITGEKTRNDLRLSGFLKCSTALKRDRSATTHIFSFQQLTLHCPLLLLQL